jgi:hypothetical protein
VQIGYLPGLAMRRIADLYPGEGKTDARDAFVIADAARTLPHALRRVGPDEQTVTALGVLAGYDADLAAEATRLTNRLHDALLHVHPALERLLGKYFRRRGVLELLAAAGTPARLRALGEDGLREAMIARSPRMALTLPAQILAALDEQTVVVPATEQYGRVISGGAAQLLAVLDQRVVVAGELDALLTEHPLAEVRATRRAVQAAMAASRMSSTAAADPAGPRSSSRTIPASASRRRRRIAPSQVRLLSGSGRPASVAKLTSG